MIDLHCHILPCLDDGSQSLNESIAMARYAVSEGIHTIVATPHVFSGTFLNPPEEIKQSVLDLQKQLKEKSIPLKLYPGSEVHMCPDMAQRILNGEALFLSENHRYVLVDFPLKNIPQSFLDEIYRLRLNGITAVIAHPERNPMIFHEKKILQDLISMDCLIQVNSTSITGGFGEDIRACAHELVKLGFAHIIASDAHSAHERPPALAFAAKIAGQILGDDNNAMAMVRERPREVLAGQPIDVT